MLLKALILILGLSVALSQGHAKEHGSKKVRKFPEGFLFGAGTASYQIEGAWNEDGKSENIWDRMTHRKPCAIVDCSSGDIAADSYHQYKRDVEMARELSLTHYRFSLSWTRILPSGFNNNINQAGVNYYNNLINELLEHNIQPLVTIYHWDLPQVLQDLGGWTNPLIVDWYTDYARVCFELFGDRVKLWSTINEPVLIANDGYETGRFAPEISVPGIGNYLAGKHVLLAHAAAYHLYDQEFRPSQNGNIFITLSAHYMAPATDSEDDIQAASDANDFLWAQFAHPIFAGDYPPRMKELVAAKSAKQGFKNSRLPEFTEEELGLIYNSSDWLGLNHYSTYLVTRTNLTEDTAISAKNDLSVIQFQPKEWKKSEVTGFLKVVPWGFTKLLQKIREDYNNPPVFICENGFSTTGDLVDDDRIDYMRSYLNAMLDAMDEGSNVLAYTYWSMMDNFSWKNGNRSPYGLYSVKLNVKNGPRVARKSALVFKHIIETNSLDMSYDPKDLNISISEGH